MRTEQLLTSPPASSTLVLGVNSTATLLRVTKAFIQTLPAIPIGGYLRLKVGTGAAAEQVKCFAILDQDLAVERGQFGTAAATHTAGAAIAFVTPDTEPALIAASTTAGWRLETFVVEELVTVAAAATTTTTVQIPAGFRALVAMTRVVVQPPGTSTCSVGISGAATRFASGASTAAGTTVRTWLDETPYASAVGILLTPNTSPSSNAGRIRVVLVGYVATLPTS